MATSAFLPLEGLGSGWLERRTHPLQTGPSVPPFPQGGSQEGERVLCSEAVVGKGLET